MLRLNTLLKKLILKMLFRSSGESIFDREWDNLIILDACRYDTFKEVIEELGINYGKLKKFTSLGSDTTEFLLKNFTKEKYENLVYVTANPFASIILKNRVYKIVPIWKYGWSEELKTVLPIYVYYYAIREYLKNPRKRFIIHFIQPHHPYILYPYKSMQKAVEMQRLEALLGVKRDFSLHVSLRRLLKVLYERKIYPIEFYVNIDLKDHKKAYKDNLRIVLPYALKLARLLPGVNVITADHGEAFGEKIHPLIPIRVYGHLPEIHIPALVEIPWYIMQGEKSKAEAISKIREELKIVSREILRLRIRNSLGVVKSDS